MSRIELIPVDKGHRLTLEQFGVTTIGRTPNIGCLEKKISRNHAELHVKPDGTVWIKPIHHNPTFLKRKTDSIVTLNKDEEYQLFDSDQIGLLPTEYFYRLSIESTEPSTPIPKTPEKEKSPSPVKDIPQRSIEKKIIEESPPHVQTEEPEGGILLHTKRAIPAWMVDTSVPEPKSGKGRGKNSKPTTPVKTPSPSKYRTYIGRKKVEGIVYDDEDEAQVTDTASSGKRERCSYGKFCYRKNPVHRQEKIHPGDPDWNDEEETTTTTTKKPECPYGKDCYRKNPDHFNEFSHNGNGRSSRKRRKEDDDEDDDDGLPNEYDYHDSFIDDDDIDESVREDRAVQNQTDPDMDWNPHQKARAGDEDDDDDSTDESELGLLHEEAGEFLNGTSTTHSRPAKKKARLHLHDVE